MLSLSVIQFFITNNSGQTLIVKPGEPKMGAWEKALESPLSEDSKTKGIVSNFHVCHNHGPHIAYVMHTEWYASSAIDQRTKCRSLMCACETASVGH